MDEQARSDKAQQVMEAVEAERRSMARALEETVIAQLNLLLAQASAYEQTLSGGPQARMAVSVLGSLARQVMQQARDLTDSLYPTLLESLGLEPALEALAAQELRARGLAIRLALQRLRERLPPQIELALFRATQEAADRALRQANARRLHIRLEKREDDLYFILTDDGIPPTEEPLRATRQRIEGLGGQMACGRSAMGGLEITIRFDVTPPIDLTEREYEVIRLVAEGMANKEIARALIISPRTVKFHLDNIYSKLGVSTRTEAAIYALRQGWVRPENTG